MGELVIVSNRAPFSFSDQFLKQGADYLAKGIMPEPPKFGEGGLVNAMAGLLKQSVWNPTWVGASLGDRDIDVARGHYTELFTRMREEGYAPEFFPQISIGQNNR